MTAARLRCSSAARASFASATPVTGSAGNLGAFALDGRGNIYVTLPAAQPPDPAQNPFGVLGLAVDCATNSLYASSIAGSTRGQEVGRIYRVDLTSGAITSQRDGIDALGVGRATSKSRLGAHR